MAMSYAPILSDFIIFIIFDIYFLVAIGAALQAASLEKRADVSPFLVRNVTPLSIGVVAANGVVRKVIKRNTAYPNQIKCVGRSIIDNQSQFYIGVFEGEHDDPRDNKKLGSMILKGIQIAGAGQCLFVILVFFFLMKYGYY